MITLEKFPAEKDTSFLRIGSLRHFLGGSNSVKGHHGNFIRSSMPSSSLDIDKVHKGYGSASSLPQLSVSNLKFVIQKIYFY